MQRMALVLTSLILMLFSFCVSADPTDPGGGGGEPAYHPTCWATGQIVLPQQDDVYTANPDGYAFVFGACSDLGVGITGGQPGKTYQIDFGLYFGLDNPDYDGDNSMGPLLWKSNKTAAENYHITLDNTGKWTKMANQDGTEDGTATVYPAFYVYQLNHHDLHTADLISYIDIITNSEEPGFHAFHAQTVGFYVVPRPRP